MACKHKLFEGPGRIDLPVGVGVVEVEEEVVVAVEVVDDVEVELWEAELVVERGGTPVSHWLPEHPAPGSGVPSQLQEP